MSPSRPGSAQWKISECACVTAQEECEGDSICLEITSQKNPADDTFIASDRGRDRTVTGCLQKCGKLKILNGTCLSLKYFGNMVTGILCYK